MHTRLATLAAISCALVLSVRFGAQEQRKVDFARDVQPILRQSCIGCHGPTIHQNGFRLDRRSAAMRGGTLAMIGPGNSEGSRMYLRLIGADYGPQMPPTGALRPEQIATIKAWIDQGAEWPDALANESAPVPMRAIDRSLMNAALFGSPADVQHALDAGADPNARNDTGSTPLLWAADSLDKTRMLLEYGADVTAKSDDGRPPIVAAAGRFGAAPIVQLLLDYGADPSSWVPGLGGMTSPLIEAAYRGDAATMRLLLARGADVKASALVGAIVALNARCGACFDLLAPSIDAKGAGIVAMAAAPPDDDGLTIAGVRQPYDVNATDGKGRTLLMRLAASDKMPVDVMKSLIAKGADANVAMRGGETAMTFATRQGFATPVVELLKSAGARNDAAVVMLPPQASPAKSIQAAIERSLPLVQQNDVTFLKKAGCVSCHNNSLTAMAVANARTHGLKVNESIARQQATAIGAFLDSWRDRVLQGIGIPGDQDTVGYMLLGLAAERYTPNDSTAAMAHFLLRQQTPSGQWQVGAHRPPIESSEIEVTATAMRALQTYAPATRKAEYDAAEARASTWLRAAHPVTTEDRAFQLFGLAWSKSDKRAIEQAGRALVAEQRADGGWAQIPSLASDAYATGQALTALAESGALKTSDAAYARGVQFLMHSQLIDGSWFVKSRAIPIQPHFESGFPHGRDQFISAAATNWAVMALAHAARPAS